jgi:hypothetical protein
MCFYRPWTREKVLIRYGHVHVKIGDSIVDREPYSQLSSGFTHTKPRRPTFCLSNAEARKTRKTLPVRRDTQWNTPQNSLVSSSHPCKARPHACRITLELQFPAPSAFSAPLRYITKIFARGITWVCSNILFLPSIHSKKREKRGLPQPLPVDKRLVLPSDFREAPSCLSLSRVAVKPTTALSHDVTEMSWQERGLTAQTPE